MERNKTKNRIVFLRFGDRNPVFTRIRIIR